MAIEQLRKLIIAIENPATRPVLDERAALQLCHGLLQLLLGVHDDRTVPRHRLLNRLARYHQKTDAFLASLNGNLRAAIEEHERVIAGVVLRVGVWVDIRVWRRTVDWQQELATFLLLLTRFPLLC